MKTIEQWLNDLPEPYRSLAFANTPTYVYNKSVTSLYDAIQNAFVWTASSQGHRYWSELQRRAGLGEFKPKHIPFDLEAAKAGKPVQMKNGTPIKRILAFNLAFPGYPLLISWEDSRGYENTAMYTAKGEPNLHGSCSGDSRDLVMVPQIVTRWVNVYRRPYAKNLETGATMYDSKELAIRSAKSITGIVYHVGAFPIEITL